MKKRSYKLKKIKDLDGNDNVVCIVGKVISLEPLLIEDEGFKIRLIMDNSNLNLGDYIRVLSDCRLVKRFRLENQILCKKYI